MSKKRMVMPNHDVDPVGGNTSTVRELAERLFCGKYPNKIESAVNIVIPFLDNVDDLFCFCLEMLMLGLDILTGYQGVVTLSKVTRDDLIRVQNSLSLIGIGMTVKQENVQIPEDDALLSSETIMILKSMNSSKLNESGIYTIIPCTDVGRCIITEITFDVNRVISN